MSLLQEANKLINGPKAADYGDFLEEGTRWADMVNAIYDTEFVAEDMALIMVLLKMVRHKKNPDRRDSRVDAAGYIGLIDKIIDSRSRKGVPYA